MKPLTHEEKKAIYKAIGRSMTPDDRHPQEVIRDDYRGDEETYLRVMAGWHNVPINKEERNAV